jgi:hypothetical protein
MSRVLVLIVLFLGIAVSAHAAFFGRGASSPPPPTPPPSGVIETVQLCSTSGSTVAANTPSPPMFPLEFKKGDVPAGQYPQLQATDGTPWGATFINVRHWSDGSMKIAGVLPGPFPKAIPTSCVTANVLNGGPIPEPSGLTPTQLYSEQIALNANGFAGAMGTALGLQGNWQAKLASDANNIEVANYGDVGGGRVYRILTHLQQGGTPHGQLEVYWYVQQLLNATGGLAGYRVLPRLTQPWYNQDVPAKDRRVFSTINIQYGAEPTTITPPFQYTPIDFAASSWTGSAFQVTVSGSMDSWRNNSQLGVPGYLTTTGTLPTGTQANYLYCAQADGFDSVTIHIGRCGYFDPIVGPTDAGTGTHTFHPAPALNHFGSLFGATTDGKYTYVQGSGTAAVDAPIQIKGDPAYDETTGLYPPWNVALTPEDSNLALPPFQTAGAGFTLMSMGVLPTVIGGGGGGGGENDNLGGPRLGYCAKWFWNRAPIDELYVRTLGLYSGLFGNAVRDVATRGPVHVGDPAKSYTGMPASLATTFQWGSDGQTGFTAPARGGPVFWFNVTDTSHMPDLAGCAYLATGEPQYLDLQMEWADQGIFDQTPSPLQRNPVISGTTYYGITDYGSGQGIRLMAWALRPMVDAASWWPDVDPAGTQIGTYLHDQERATTAFPQLYMASLPSGWQKTNCYWITGGVPVAPWHRNYMNYVMALAYNADEDANGLAFLNCSRPSSITSSMSGTQAICSMGPRSSLTTPEP